MTGEPGDPAPEAAGPLLSWPVMAMGLATLGLGFVLGRQLLAPAAPIQPAASPTAVAAAAGSALEPTPGPAAATSLVGQRAPSFRVWNPAGETVSLEDLLGQPILLNFFATWCGPCRVEMPHLEAAWRRHKAAGLVVLAMDVREAPEQVTTFLAELGLSFPSALDADGEVASRYKVRILPTSYFIDRAGQVARVKVGFYQGENALAKDLAHILDPVGSPTAGPGRP